MKVKICWTKGEFEDSIVLTGTLEEIQKRAQVEIDKRNPDHYWSVVLEE